MSEDALAKLREICLALPDVEEAVSWGHPSFKVAGKMFAGYEEVKGRWTVGVKLEAEHAELLEGDPLVVSTAALGKHRWVAIYAERIDDWDGVSDLIMDAYRLSAPKRTLAKL